VLEQDSFAGEGIMDLLHPGEQRLLSYPADRAVRVVKDKNSVGSKRVTRVTDVKGVLYMYVEDRETTTYIVHDADTTSRKVVLEHPIRNGWKLIDDVKPEKTSATLYRFRVGVEPGKTEKFTVKERHPDVSSTYVSNLTDKELATYVHDGSIEPELESQLRNVIGKRWEIFNLDQDAKSVQQEMESIDKDQSRLRENMKALQRQSRRESTVAALHEAAR
jgi:hypothetical protein